MSLFFRRFGPADIVMLDVQPSQQDQMGAFEPVRDIAHGAQLQAAGESWTATDCRGAVIACFGVANLFGDVQASAWLLLSPALQGRVKSQGLMLRFARARLDHLPHIRIEAMARAASRRECAFLEALDFERAHLLRKWGPKSEDYVLYERVR